MPDARSASPLVGRDTELAVLRQAVGLDDSVTGPVIVGGDAGIGKTRLLREVGAAARDHGYRVLVGHCLDIGDSALPLQPFSELFWSIAESERAALAERFGALTPMLRREIADQADRGELFAAITAGLDELAADQPVLVVIEDAHWADSSTRRLLRFVLTYVFSNPVHVLVSYRADDLHRRHPLRQALAEWVRLPDVRRIELEPLADTEVGELVQNRAERRLDQTELRAVVKRAGGNAFYAEELLDAGADDPGVALPVSLSDLLIVRCDRLDDAGRVVVRAASCAVGPASEAGILAVTDLSSAEVEAGLRSAIDERILVPGKSGYHFRHALVAEAVRDDLLPGERRRIHQAYLDAATSGEITISAAGLAAHAIGANDFARAFSASVEAGHDAARLAGYDEAAQHFEQALGHLEYAADDFDVVGLVLDAADSTMASGHVVRSQSLVADHLASLPTDAPIDDRVRLMVKLANVAFLANDDDTAEQVTSEAFDLLGDADHPSRAALMAQRVRLLLSAGRDDAAVSLAERAMALAELTDQSEVVADIRISMMRAAARTGAADLDKATEHYVELIDRSRKAGDVIAELRGWHNLGFVMLSAGRLEDGEKAFLSAMRTAAANGRAWAPYGIDGRVFAAVSMVVRGEWDAADRLLRHGPEAPRLASAALTGLRSVIQAGRGDFDGLADASRVRAFWTRDISVVSHSAAGQIELYGLRGDIAKAEWIFDEAARVFAEHWKTPRTLGRLRHTALLISAFADSVPAAGDQEIERMVSRAVEIESELTGVIEHWSSVGPEGHAWRHRAIAELARLCSVAKIDPPAPSELAELWRTDVRNFDEFGQPFEAARARVRLAAALGDSKRAIDLLDLAEPVAQRLRAQPLLDDISALRTVDAPTPSVLTSREHEVLEQVAQGLSNGEIAKVLFISTKTVSVHVSNILAKLGAASRTEAAAIARRDGLLLDEL